MAIDRTAFETWVNDDGSGTTGTVLTKERMAQDILDPIDAAIATASPPPSGGATPSTFLVQGGQVAWESAYTFRVSAAEYYINGTHLTSAEGTATLGAAHATLDRLDVLALDTAGAVVVIPGTAAAQPSEPSVDPAAYLKLVIVQVLHATTQPPDLGQLTLYAENAGGPTEWAWTSSGASLVLNSTTTPHAGTTAIEGTNVVAGVYAQGTRAAGTIDPNAYDSLVLFLRSKAAWNNNRGLLLTLRAAGVLVGASVQIRRSGTYGFDSALTSAYQMVAIPLIAFAVPQGTLIDQIRVEDFGGAIGFYLDDVSLQTGATSGGGGGGLSQDQADARYASLVHASRHATGGADPITGLAVSALSPVTGPSAIGRATGTGTAETLPLGQGLAVTGSGELIATARTSGVFDYVFNSVDMVAPPANQRIRFNAGYPYTAVTTIWADFDSANSEDLYWGWMRITPGSYLMIQDKDNHDQFAEFIVSSAPVDSGTYATLTVTHKAHGGIALATQAVLVRVTTVSAPATRIGALGLIIDGGGAVITTGVKGFLSVPFACTITGWTLLSTDAAATAGSIVVDVWKDTYANYPPTVADTITASAKPTLSSVNKNTSTTLTGWTTAIAAGDVLGFNVDSAATVTRVALSLTVQVT